MTTIATDGNSMAGDGQGDVEDCIVVATRCKIRRLADGSLLGMAGNGADNDKLADWLLSGGKRPKFGELQALRLFPDGQLEYLNEDCDPIIVDVPCAVGSGMEFAIGAMDAGASPKQAVAIAAKRDLSTGGKITTLNLEKA